MTNPDRLTGLDASFLALEDAGAHMHVGSCMLFEGEAPGYEDFVAQLDSRLHLVPRYRQKLAFPPLSQARPVWVDDPHFNPGYHVRHTALPEPASLEQLRNLSGRVLAQRLDRTKPLWEIWLVQRVEGGRFAVLSKTHHCLVDGVSGVDIATVLFDLEPEPPPPPEPPPAWFPRPQPSSATLDRRLAGRARLHSARPRAPRRRLARAPRAGRRAARQGRRRRRRGARRRPAGRAARARTTSRSARTAGSRGPTATSASSRPSRRRWAAPSTTSC